MYHWANLTEIKYQRNSLKLWTSFPLQQYTHLCNVHYNPTGFTFLNSIIIHVIYVWVADTGYDKILLHTTI